MPKQPSLPTQEFIDAEAVENDVIWLKGGGLRKVILVSGLNMGLKSEEEQEIIIYSFQGFLNSIDFSVQFFIHSRKLNIEDYLTKLQEREAQEINELLRNQITEYREFIRTFVTQNAIMQKRFFVVIPYDPIKIPQAGAGLAKKLLGFFKSKEETAANSQKEYAAEYLTQLEQRVDQIIGGLNQIGLRAVPLNNEELIELLYNLYNPATIEKRGIEITKS